MSDFNDEKEKWYPSTDALVRLRNAAIFYFSGGFVLAVLQFLGRIRIIGLVAGVVLCAVGIGWIMANNPNNKKTGAMLTGIGILLVLSRAGIYLLMVVAQTVLNIVTIGFLVMGIRYLVRYFVTASKRN